MEFPLIKSTINTYRDNVQGKANEPITVAGLLDRAKLTVGYDGEVDWTLYNIYDRLENNSPRIAIIGGSEDHPAHILDIETVSYVALRIWENGGVPFYFSTPVLCDGTAQSNIGMSYSLQSRNAIAEVVINQMEAHSYHGAFVIQGCDKQPLGVISGLAYLDRLRQSRGEASVFATFAPAHVLQGGTIPDKVKVELEELALKAEGQGYDEIASDIRDTLKYILQCTTNSAFQGVLTRAVELGLLSSEEHKGIERHLAVYTCDSKGGICAFNGTGNSSRNIVSGFGFIHPVVELLTEPPNRGQINQVADSMGTLINKADYGVANIVAKNIRNAIRIHSASGGSTNLIMHFVGAVRYAGYDFTLWDYANIHKQHPIPDLFDYSLTDGRDIYVLAEQCCTGNIRGMETLFYELTRNGVPMDGDAPTVTGASWNDRLNDKTNLSADGVDNQIILSKPKRSFSGIDVLTSNFFESAVVKISGMTTEQLDNFDEKLAFMLYFINEEEANKELLNPRLIEDLKNNKAFDYDLMKQMWRVNDTKSYDKNSSYSYDELFTTMIIKGILKIAIIIAGQGPKAFGMPEMFTPMQHINSNQAIKRLTVLISDGRYSGASYGAAIGHLTPEAINKGKILYLQTGDVLQLQLRKREINLLDSAQLKSERILPIEVDLCSSRELLGEHRLKELMSRQRLVAATNRMLYCTDAAKGVVPSVVSEEAIDRLAEWDVEGDN